MRDIFLDPTRPTPLYKQLYQQLRDAILAGELAAGTQLLPSRTLATRLGIGRVTVKAAYEQLAIEGYVESYVGAGTWVADLPILSGASTGSVDSLSAWASRAAENGSTPLNHNSTLEYDFGFGRSFPHHFPYDIWRKLLSRYLSTDDTILSRYGSAAGFEPLREVLVSYLQRARGITCRPEQVVIVNGMQQAVDILARLLIRPSDSVAVENPGYVEAYRLLAVHGARLLPLPVDADGLQVDALPTSPQCRLAFVTPANQFPRGGMLSLPRRLQLLRWARENSAYIIEDDYDSELRYDNHPISALKSIDQQERVIYVGTFSKVLFPALRLAYVVLPPQLVPHFLTTKRLLDRGSPTLTQAAIADFIREGHFEKHLKRLRDTYARRRAALTQALQIELPQLSWVDVPAGLHITVQLPSELSELHVVGRAREQGIGVYPAAAYYLTEPTPPQVLLAFSGIAAERIPEGIQRFSTIF